MKSLQAERDALVAQLEGIKANLSTAASLAEEQVSLSILCKHSLDSPNEISNRPPWRP